jgi:hypothetical protein
MTTSTKSRRKPAKATTTPAEAPAPKLVERVELLTYDNGVKRTRVVDCTGPEDRIVPLDGRAEPLADRLTEALANAVAVQDDVERFELTLTMARLTKDAPEAETQHRTMVCFAVDSPLERKIAAVAELIAELTHMKTLMVADYVELDRFEKSMANVSRH